MYEDRKKYVSDREYEKFSTMIGDYNQMLQDLDKEIETYTDIVSQLEQKLFAKR